ncbi:MAG: flagellar biosynthesis regulator FlaF [Chromatiaceae bacterium]|jgi:flagellar biosynthesis activator protein FlaF|nr:flagellar biosynthesis regulator FlaF [Hydrogenophilales bacterium]MBP6582636.1 flagellar biosynthesis regulator FlaF [Chromatiaceae bacterium]MBP6807150.1 flagellar biosynthesis regulator FlaF [Chromatiaceae bacterium]
MPRNPFDAYQDVERATLTGRGLEAMVLNKAVAMLQNVLNRWDEPDHEALLEEALRYNQRLWTFFQVELSADDNPLPRALRENLLSLSVFVDNRTFELMTNPAPEKLDILITINKNIAAGLRDQAADTIGQDG